MELVFKSLVSRLSCKQLGSFCSHFYQDTMKETTTPGNFERFLEVLLSHGEKADPCSFDCTEIGTNKQICVYYKFYAKTVIIWNSLNELLNKVIR